MSRSVGVEETDEEEEKGKKKKKRENENSKCKAVTCRQILLENTHWSF